VSGEEDTILYYEWWGVVQWWEWCVCVWAGEVKCGIDSFIVTGKKKCTYLFCTSCSYPVYFILMLKAVSFTYMAHVTFDIIICHTLCVVNMHFRNVWFFVRLDSKAFSCRVKLARLFLNTTCLKTPVRQTKYSIFSGDIPESIISRK